MVSEPHLDEIEAKLRQVMTVHQCDDCGQSILDPRETDFIIQFYTGSVVFISEMYDTTTSPEKALQTLKRAYTGEVISQIEELEVYRSRIETVVDMESGVVRCANCVRDAER